MHMLLETMDRWMITASLRAVTYGARVETLRWSPTLRERKPGLRDDRIPPRLAAA